MDTINPILTDYLSVQIIALESPGSLRLLRTREMCERGADQFEGKINWRSRFLRTRLLAECR